MRVLIVTTQDRFFLSHIKERAAFFFSNGWTISVAAQKTSDEFVREIESMGFRFYNTKIKRKSINPFTQLVALYRLYKIQRHFKPNICFHLGAKAIFYGTFTARLFNPQVGIVNAPIGLGYVYASQSFKAKLLRPFVSCLYKIFLNPINSRVIIENPDDISFFIEKNYINPKDAFCIPGAGVDTNVFCPKSFDQRNPTITMVMAARLIKEKGVFDYVEVAKLLHQNKVPIRVQLLGVPDPGNPSSLSLTEYKFLTQEPAIECYGFQNNISKFLQQAHIFCLPSFYREGLPRCLVEATSCGLAILTTDSVGCREAIKGNNGFLFKPHDIRKLYELVCYLVDHPRELKEMGESSRKIALTYFDSKIISQRTYELLTNLATECQVTNKTKHVQF